MGWYGRRRLHVPSTGVQNSSHLGASVTFTMPFTFSFEEYNNNNIYLLQLGCYPVAVVILHFH